MTQVGPLDVDIDGIVARVLREHLPGKHDQKTHGRGSAGAAVKIDNVVAGANTPYALADKVTAAISGAQVNEVRLYANECDQVNTHGSFDLDRRNVLISEDISKRLVSIVEKGKVNESNWKDFHVLVHEVHHSSSPLLKADSKPKGYNWNELEEGLNEHFSRQISQRMAFGNNVPSSIRLASSPYTRDLRAVNWMEQQSPGIARRIWNANSPEARWKIAEQVIKPGIEKALASKGYKPREVQKLVSELGHRGAYQVVALGHLQAWHAMTRRQVTLKFRDSYDIRL